MSLKTPVAPIGRSARTHRLEMRDTDTGDGAR